MLNTAPTAAPGPLAALATLAPTPGNSGAGEQPFAKALDQASNRQREAAARHDDDAPRESDEAAADDDAAAAPPAEAAHAARTPQPRRLPRAQLPQHAASVELPATASARAQALHAERAQAVPETPTDDDPAAAELAALIGGLLPPTSAHHGPVASASGRAGGPSPDNRAAADPALDSARQTQPRWIEAGVARGDGAANETKARAPAQPPGELAGVAVLPAGSASAVAASENTGLARAVSLAEARTEAGVGAAGAPASLPASTQGLLAPGASARPADAAATFSAQLGAALGSPEFAPALGAQLSLMVRDGIQHAQLQLHPREMGPISVRISLDGNQAQVDFSAAQAATRQALEDAVPVLASALREAGLTLSGGGVFQQPRDARDTGAQPNHAHSGTPPGADPGDVENARHGAALPARQRGIVDLVA